MSEEMKKGGISVDTEHIFPVIKRWLYSDKEIFLRELVSNGCDAVTKMKRLVSLLAGGNYAKRLTSGGEISASRLRAGD